MAPDGRQPLDPSCRPAPGRFDCAPPCGTSDTDPGAYRLRFESGGATWEEHDPYRFGPVLGEMDEHFISEGSHLSLWRVLGAHPMTHEGVEGTHFAVWAPNAERVSVIGDFNNWDPNAGPLLNRAAFENGSAGGVFSFTPGSGGRTTNIRQSAFRKLDLVVEKSISVTERFKFQLRGEFFNVLNNHYFTQGTTWGQGGAIVTDVGSPLFGTWTGAVTTPRNVQLAGRLTF